MSRIFNLTLPRGRQLMLAVEWEPSWDASGAPACSSCPCGLGFSQPGCRMAKGSITYVQKQKFPEPWRPGFRSPGWPFPLCSVGQSSHRASFPERGNRLGKSDEQFTNTFLFLLYGTQYAQHVPQALLHGSFLVQCSSPAGYIASVSAELPGSNAPKFRCFQETLILVAGCPVIDGLRGPSLVLLRIFFEGLKWDGLCHGYCGQSRQWHMRALGGFEGILRSCPSLRG